MSKLKIEPVKQPDRIINYWKKEKFVVACIVFFGLSFNAAAVLGPVYQGRLIDAVASGMELNSIIILAAVFVAIIGIIQLLRYFKRFYIRRFANLTSASMRLMLFNNIINKSTAELENENTGSLMTRTVSDVELCVEGMRKFTTEIFDTGVLMASYVVSMLIYSVQISLAAVIFVPAAMLLAEKLKNIIYKYSVDYRKKSGEIADMTYDRIENSMLYRLCGRETTNSLIYGCELEELKDKAIKANILESSMQPIYNGIAMLGAAAVIYMGGNMVIDGDWTIGMFSAYITIFTALAVKASKAAKLFNSVQKSQVSWLRIKPYLTDYMPSPPRSNNLPPSHTHLEVDDLCFRYAEQNGDIINHINFSAKQGEIIGITGAIASGKSTLALALLGLYPYSGSIRINGKELKVYTASERSQMISYLGHNAQLLSDTIYNNITLGADVDVTDTLRDVCFDADLKTMPDGINTPVGNSGVRLSGGQQARIGLARALLHKCSIIILDDPFSAVDMKTEEAIIESLRNNYKNSLIILVSHRLAIFNKIDNVILLNNDKTAICGTHAELMESSPVYATIYGLQERGAISHE